MAQLKSIPRMPPKTRLRQVKDLTALKGGTAFDDEDGQDPLPPLRPLVSAFGDDEDDEVALIHRRMGNRASDAKLAQRVWGWQQQLPGATIPEAIVYDYLKLDGRPFQYQQYVYGGRTARNGVVPDFLVEQGGEWMVWNVQGEYWHSEGVNEGKDRSQRYRLLGAIILGLRVAAVVELWEDDIYNKRPMVFDLAWAGRGLRE